MCYARHGVLFYRELSWHDVAFYNADLYEGLRRMIRDVESEKNSVEDFKATYCCYFEVGCRASQNQIVNKE